MDGKKRYGDNKTMTERMKSQEKEKSERGLDYSAEQT